MIEATGLTKHYPVATGVRALFSGRGARDVRAVSDVTFSVAPGRVLGIVGESGCGKSTLAKILVGLEAPSGGTFAIDEANGEALLKRDRRAFYRRIQMVFQDPYASLNPSHDVRRIVASPLIYQGVKDAAAIEAKVLDALGMVGLRPADRYIDRHPHLLSGGQRQRICIARALVLDPGNLIADEPVSMLDVSIKWDIVRLLRSLVRERDLSLVYITHDLATVSSICDEIAIMYLGRIVEIGPARDILREPAHPYTRALIAATPGATRDRSRDGDRIGDPHQVMHGDATGCALAPRCPRRDDVCVARAPALEERLGRKVACHRVGAP
jgi:oligopeptide/dipeptide ABC transporter ATP-binding protein